MTKTDLIINQIKQVLPTARVLAQTISGEGPRIRTSTELQIEGTKVQLQLEDIRQPTYTEGEYLEVTDTAYPYRTKGRIYKCAATSYDPDLVRYHGDAGDVCVTRSDFNASTAEAFTRQQYIDNIKEWFESQDVSARITPSGLDTNVIYAEIHLPHRAHHVHVKGTVTVD